MIRRFAVLALGLCSMACGCSGPSTPQVPTPQDPTRPLAAGTLMKVTIWDKPVGGPGEIGQNKGLTPPEGSRVEVYDQFILVTPPRSPTILSVHGWYSNLSFKRDP